MTARRPRKLADYVSAARRRQFALLIPMLILAFAAGAALREQPNLYESSARLLLQSHGGLDLSGRIDEFRRHITTRDALEAIASKNVHHETLEARIAQMRGRIAIESDARPDVQPGAFTISYLAADPETARGVTSDLADLLVAQSLEESSPGTEVEVLRKRTSDISRQLRELEERDPWLLGVTATIAAVGTQSARSSQLSLEARRVQQLTVESIKDQQYKFQQQLADLERRVGAQRQIVEQQKRGSSLRDNPTYSALIIRRTELQGLRDTLLNRQELTDKHPRVSAINDQIAAVNRQIEELSQQDTALASQSPEARELAALESERNRLKIDLEVAGRELARRSASLSTQPATVDSTATHPEAGASKLAQEYLALKRSYTEVASELQDVEAKHKSPSTAASEQLSLIESANLPERPVSPNRPLLIAIAAAVGLALGAVFALLAEARRLNSLQDARDVEYYYARLPLLAEIPRTTTESERRRASWWANARLAFAVTGSIAATFVLTKVFIALDIFTLVN